MKKRFIIVLAMLCTALSNYAQSPPQIIRPLTIGDTVPDLLLTNIINYPVSKIQLSELHKGKYLVLDFWSTLCVSCIKGFPKIYQLQKKYGDQVSFLLLNSKSKWDERPKIESFFAQRAEAYTLASVIEDTVLTQLFPHQSVPHGILIDQDGLVRCIFNTEELNDGNIRALLYQNKIELAEKKETDYDPNKLLFVDGNGGKPDSFLFRSILTGYVAGLRSSSRTSYSNRDKTLVNGIHCSNERVLYLLTHAYPRFVGYPMSRTILNVKDPSTIFADGDGPAWERKHLYNYELSFPPRPEGDALKMMREDLKRYFGLTIRMERRKTTCLVLRRSGSPISKCPVGTPPGTNIYEKDGLAKYMNNLGLWSLQNLLDTELPIPFIDETGYRENVCLSLPADPTDIKTLTKALAKQGFLLTKEQRELPFRVIEDITVAPGNNNPIHSSH